MASITTYPITTSISSSDKIFVNSNGQLKQITETNLENIVTSDLQTEVNNLRTLVNTLSSSLSELESGVYYQNGETVTFPRAFGCFVGIKFNDTTLHLAIPVAKRMKRTPTLDSDIFSINTWYESGSKTLNVAPTSIEVTANTNAVPLIVLRATYDSSVIANLPREFAWRFNSINNNYWKFTF